MTTPNDNSSEVACCPRLQHNKQGQKRRRHGSDIRTMCCALFEEDGAGCLAVGMPVCDDDEQGMEGCRGAVMDRRAIRVDIEGHMRPAPRQRHHDPAPDPGWSQGIDGSQRRERVRYQSKEAKGGGDRGHFSFFFRFDRLSHGLLIFFSIGSSPICLRFSCMACVTKVYKRDVNFVP